MNPPLSQVALLENAEWARQVAFAMVRDASLADDLVQEALRIGLEKPPSDPDRIRPWLARVIQNNFRIHLRGSGRRTRRERHVAREDRVEEEPHQGLALKETLESVSQAVLALQEPFQSTLLLHYWDGLTLKEIGQRTGAPVRTVESRLRKGRLLVKERLQREGGEVSWLSGLMPLLALPKPRPWLLGSTSAVAAVSAILLIGIATLGPDKAGPASPPVEGLVAQAGITEVATQPIPSLETESLGREGLLGEPPLLSTAARPTRDRMNQAQIQVLSPEGVELPIGLELLVLHLGPLPEEGILPLEDRYQARNREWRLFGQTRHDVPADGLFFVTPMQGADRIQVMTTLNLGGWAFKKHRGQRQRRSVYFAGQGWQSVEIQLQQMGGVTHGKLVTTDQEPFPGGALQLWSGVPDASLWKEIPDRIAPCEADGTFWAEDIGTEGRPTRLSASAEGWTSTMTLNTRPGVDLHHDDLTFIMVPCRPVDVFVKDEHGQALSGIKVTAIYDGVHLAEGTYPNGSMKRRRWRGLPTDRQGRMHFASLPEQVRLHVESNGSRLELLQTLKAERQWEVRVRAFTSLAGRLEDASGLPLAGIRVHASNGITRKTALSEDAGAFHFQEMPGTSPWALHVDTPGFAPLTFPVGNPKEWGHLLLTLEKGASLSGRLALAPTEIPHAGATVRVRPHGPEADETTPPSRHWEVPVEADGSFRFEHFADGPYLLRYLHSDGNEWSVMAWSGEQGVVLDAEGSHLLHDFEGNLQLPFVPESSGKLPRLRLHGVVPSDDGPAPGPVLHEFPVGTDGSYRFPNLLEGRYVLCIWDPQGTRHFHRTVDLPRDLHACRDLEIPEVDTLRLVFHDVDGNPQANLQAKLFERDVLFPPAGHQVDRARMVLSTSPKGVLLLNGLPIQPGLRLQMTRSTPSETLQWQFEVEALRALARQGNLELVLDPESATILPR